MKVNFDSYTWLLTGLEVGKESRGTGYGRVLLDMVLEDADKNQQTIILSVSPNGTGLSYSQLCDFYGRSGFESMPAYGETAMIRKPQARF